MVTVAVAHTHPMVCGSIRSIIERIPEHEMIGQAHDGHSALDLCRQLKPDILFLDVTIPRLSSLEVTRALQREQLCTKPLVFTMGVSEHYLVLDVLQAGAAGCVVIEDDYQQQIVTAVESVTKGTPWYSPSLVQRLFSSKDQPAVSTPLSIREIEVLSAMARSMGNAEIARSLGISTYTVQNHITAIYNKLGTRKRSAAILYAIQHRLVNFDDLSHAS